jgi:hypothetical protein
VSGGCVWWEEVKGEVRASKLDILHSHHTRSVGGAEARERE